MIFFILLLSLHVFVHSSLQIAATNSYLQEIADEIDVKVKYLRGEGGNLEVIKDKKKLKGQLAIREELYGKSAKAAAKAEEWLMPSEGCYLEVEGIEKTWKITQEAIAREVDILSSRNQYDIVLPGSRVELLLNTVES
ncbi:hypothetical protein U1Q18_038271 [Sarracenia purpurea var. burkii]